MPTISIWLTDENKERLDRLSEKENRSVSNMVSLLVIQEDARRQQLALPLPSQEVPATEGK